MVLSMKEELSLIPREKGHTDMACFTLIRRTTNGRVCLFIHSPAVIVNFFHIWFRRFLRRNLRKQHCASGQYRRRHNTDRWGEGNRSVCICCIGDYRTLLFNVRTDVVQQQGYHYSPIDFMIYVFSYDNWTYSEALSQLLCNDKSCSMNHIKCWVINCVCGLLTYFVNRFSEWFVESMNHVRRCWSWMMD